MGTNETWEMFFVLFFQICHLYTPMHILKNSITDRTDRLVILVCKDITLALHYLSKLHKLMWDMEMLEEAKFKL